MTIEEARIRVKNIISNGKAFPLNLTDSEIEALEEVIKASEKEPCEITHGSTYGGVSWGGTYKPQQTTDGAVSRQVITEQMIKYGFRAPDITVTEFVEDLPPVNPQEPIADRIEYGTDGNLYKITISNGKEFEQGSKTGHWIDTGSGQECSNCHEIQYGYDNHRLYCANCGSRNVAPQPYKAESEEV